MQFVILFAGAFLLITLLSMRRTSGEPEAPQDYDRVKNEVLRLRDRVRTLERIVTDPRDNLSRDIDKL
ncbi:MAG: hypothetical protein CMK07_01985 [Ponticaulis sp.]|nr:hypothetical protein [Ponticaulis sp.]